MEFHLLKDLASQFQPSLNDILQELGGVPETTHQPPKAVGKFLKALACTTPVCALISQSEVLYHTLIGVINGTTTHLVSETFKILQTEAPILASLFISLPDGNPSLHPIFKELLRLAAVPFEGRQQSLPVLNNQQPEPHSYFPTLHKKCERGLYDMDKSKKSGTKQCGDEKGFICQKKVKGHPTLTPGIFTVFCPHGT